MKIKRRYIKRIKKSKTNEEKKINYFKIILIQSLILILIYFYFKIEVEQNKLIYRKLNNLNQNVNNTLDLDMDLFKKKINEIYQNTGVVNINEIESKINKGRPWDKNNFRQNAINLGFHIDNKYILRCMFTITSIMDSQSPNTKVRFHFALIYDFDAEQMLKIYSLRKRVREDVEFNFYNARRVEKDLKGLSVKGPGLASKLLLPQLVPDDVERLFILDTGDLMVIKDLTEVYNWDLKGALYAGPPAGSVGRFAVIHKKVFDIYISAGSFLVDVKKVKEENMFEKFIKHKNAYKTYNSVQDLLNDVAFGRITYFPFKFGMISPYQNDKNSEKAEKDNTFSSYMKKIKLQEIFKFLPKDETEFLRMGYSPYVIHHMHGKWMVGKDLTVYRRLAQYYIKYAGIWDEMCKEFPGYCK